ncbi:MAG: serine/threonine protein kinase [Deltaproteobacteria bacterium]|nr:MAG: serine/threonine protein kinase [Deltaproteobacteria bacterium]
MAAERHTCPQCKTSLEELIALGSELTFCLQCQFPLMLIAGKYRLESLFAEGGFGQLYLARHVRLKRNARRMVKILKPNLFSNKKAVTRFTREIQLTAELSLHNEHIVRIYDDFGWIEVLGYYYVMEFLEGDILHNILRKDGAMPLRKALSLFGQLCASLYPAHERGVVHRDLKPKNIMLCQRPHRPDYIKIFDFGIAHAMESHGRTHLGLTQGALGTPLYMSPEQAMNAFIDGRADQYSLAIILYQMLTGVHPIRLVAPNAKERVEVMAAHISKPFPPMRQAAPHIELPEGMEEVVQRGFAKDPDERYPSVVEFWEAAKDAAGKTAKGLLSDPFSVEEMRALAPQDKTIPSTPSAVLLGLPSAEEPSDEPWDSPKRTLINEEAATPDVAEYESDAPPTLPQLGSVDLPGSSLEWTTSFYQGSRWGLILVGVLLLGALWIGWLAMFPPKEPSPDDLSHLTNQSQQPSQSRSPTRKMGSALSGNDNDAVVPDEPPQRRAVVVRKRSHRQSPNRRRRTRRVRSRRRWRARRRVVRVRKRVVVVRERVPSRVVPRIRPRPVKPKGCRPGFVSFRTIACSEGEGGFVLTMGQRELRFYAAKSPCVPKGTRSVALEQRGCRTCFFSLQKQTPRQLRLKNQSDENLHLDQDYCVR